MSSQFSVAITTTSDISLQGEKVYFGSQFGGSGLRLVGLVALGLWRGGTS